MSNPIAPLRHRLTIDVHDEDEVKDFVVRLLADQVLTRNEPVPGIHLLTDDHHVEVDWTSVREADPEADLAATWNEIAPSVDRALCILGLEHADGTTEACGYLETWEDGACTWWLTHRKYVVSGGIAELLGEGWELHEGEGPPPSPLRQMLELKPGARAARLLPPRAPEPEVWMQADAIPPGTNLPRTAMQMAEMTQAVALGQLEREGFKHTMVFVLKSRTWEKWLIGRFPMDGDDTVRWICGREGTPVGVATAEAVLLTLDGKPERVVRVMAEMGGHRAERLLVMAPKPDSPENVALDRVMAREHAPVAEGEGWIGVEPLLPEGVTLRPIGVGEPK